MWTGIGKSSHHFDYICCAVGHPLFIACPPGHIISIGSAEVHLSPHSPFWNPDRACGHCELTEMTCPLPRRLHENVRACNRRQYCYITQDLNHAECTTFADENFIRLHTVFYNCITGKLKNFAVRIGTNLLRVWAWTVISTCTVSHNKRTS